MNTLVIELFQCSVPLCGRITIFAVVLLYLTRWKQYSGFEDQWLTEWGFVYTLLLKIDAQRVLSL